MGSTPSIVHVQRVMRETAVRTTPTTVIPILVKMEEIVRWVASVFVTVSILHANTFTLLILTQDLINDYLCVCETGWTGETCSVNIDYCATDPCQNGGTCFVSSRAVVLLILRILTCKYLALSD